MKTTFAGLFAAIAIVVGTAGAAHAQVVIQGQGQGGGVYGQGSVYVQGGAQAQPSPYATQPQPYGAQAQPSPYVAQAQTQPQPTQTIVHTSMTTALFVPGVIALGVGWIVSGLGALGVYENCGTSSGLGSGYYGGCPYPVEDWVGWSWLPVVGPWIALGTAQDTGDYGWLNVLTGIVQDAGLVMMILGIAIQQEWEEAVYADLGEGRRLTFTGGASQNGASVGASLTF